MRKRSEGYPALAVIVVVAAGMLALPMSLGSAEVFLVGDVDVGDTESEAGYVLTGWGDPLEVTGSSWGGLEDDLRVVWAPGGDENWAEITFLMPENFHGSLHTIYMDVLDGVADDSFTVSVWDATKGVWNEIFYYASHNLGATDPVWGIEVWNPHTISLTEDKCLGDGYFDFPRGYPIYGDSGFTIRITATGAQWDYFSTYGQLGVDRVNLEGNGILL